jgi:hypothetical protein
MSEPPPIIVDFLDQATSGECIVLRFPSRGSKIDTLKTMHEFRVLRDQYRAAGCERQAPGNLQGPREPTGTGAINAFVSSFVLPVR